MTLFFLRCHAFWTHIWPADDFNDIHPDGIVREALSAFSIAFFRHSLGTDRDSTVIKFKGSIEVILALIAFFRSSAVYLIDACSEVVFANVMPILQDSHVHFQIFRRFH